MNLVIVSAARSGSSWLLNAISGNNFVNLKEFFNDAVSPEDKISKENLYDYYSKPRALKILSKLSINPIDYSLLEDIRNKISQKNKDCIHKVLYESYILNPSNIIKSINTSGIIIGLYRNNILSSYISLKKAVQTNIWSYQNNKSKDKIKIHWDKNDYLNFYHKRVEAINWIKSFSINKNYCLFSYEEIHDTNKTNCDKIKIIQSKVKDITNFEININTDYKNYLKKEITNNNYIEHFYNTNNLKIPIDDMPKTYADSF